MNAISNYNSIPNGRQSVGIPHSTNVMRNVVPKVKKVPECPLFETRNWLIHTHYTRKEFVICKILIQEELENSKGMSEYANFIQGLILRHEGKVQESLEYFQSCHSLNPMNVENIKQVAKSLYLLGRHRLSLDAYSEAESLVSRPHWDIYYNLGMCLVHLNDFPKAKECISKAISLSKQVCCYIALAKIYLLENDINKAIEIYTSANEFFPDNSDISTTLGILYMRNNQYQESFEKLGSALAHDPKCCKALLAVGSMMQNHKDVDVALSKYKVASQLMPESAPLWNNIGMCFFGKRKFVIAISCLKRATYLAPFDWKILYNLGLLHLTIQQYASAFHYLSASINLYPRSGKTYMLLAMTLNKLKDPENAKNAFDQATKLELEDPALPLNYAVFLYSIGNAEDASIQLRKFQELAEGTSDITQDMLEIANKLSLSLSNDNQPESSGLTKQDAIDMDPDEVNPDHLQELQRKVNEERPFFTIFKGNSNWIGEIVYCTSEDIV